MSSPSSSSSSPPSSSSSSSSSWPSTLALLTNAAFFVSGAAAGVCIGTALVGYYFLKIDEKFLPLISRSLRLKARRWGILIARSSKEEEDGAEEKAIYMDYNATTPIHESVYDAMLPYLKEHFGNPSSSYSHGQAAKKAIDQARYWMAVLLNADTDEIVFNSCSTESINYCIKGAALAMRAASPQRHHIITCVTEHVACLEACKAMESLGFDVTYLPVDEQGHITVEQVEKAVVKGETALVTLMLANNETGAIHDIAAIAQAVKKIDQDIIVHSDCSQATGKINVDATYLFVDLLTIAGHKMYAPKGIGATFIKRGTRPLKNLLHGGNQETNRRAGTENVALIVGLGAAAKLIVETYTKNLGVKLKESRDYLLKCIQEGLRNHDEEEGRLNTDLSRCLPNTLSIGFNQTLATHVLHAVSSKVSASAGAACHSAADGKTVASMSFVLKAMQVPEPYGLGTIRLSVGMMTTDAEIEECAETLIDAICAARKKNRQK